MRLEPSSYGPGSVLAVGPLCAVRGMRRRRYDDLEEVARGLDLRDGSVSTRMTGEGEARLTSSVLMCGGRYGRFWDLGTKTVAWMRAKSCTSARRVATLSW